MDKYPVETPIYEPARCGASLVGGYADLRELAWGSHATCFMPGNPSTAVAPRCSDWRRVSLTATVQI